jgi:hypothetical protein
MYFNNNFSGKYWAIFGSTFSGPPGDPDYRGAILLREQCAYIIAVFSKFYGSSFISVF